MSERRSEKQVGYDCRFGRCQHEEKDNHGISGGTWKFIVQDGPVAVALEVLTSFYPESVTGVARESGWPYERQRITGAVEFHRGVPAERDREGCECTYVPGGRCYDFDVGYSMADAFAPLLGETFENQSEAFWRELERRAAEFRDEVEHRAVSAPEDGGHGQ